jgi:VanZ family protein
MIRKNTFSILVALVILYLSLANSDTFQNVPLIQIPNIDKIIHFGMYFSLMSVIFLENRKSINGTRQIFLIAVIPFAYGILMEVFQSIFTLSRTASFFDIIANSTGILTSVFMWLFIKHRVSGKIK